MSGAGPGPTLVALTGWGSEEDQRRSRSSGFDLHLTNPVSIEALDEALQAWARRTAQVPG